MRGKVKARQVKLEGDPRYKSLTVAKFINYVMKCGKKNVARRIVYEALEGAMKELKAKDGDKLLEDTLKKVAPIVEVRSKRVGGANYQVPIEVREPRKTALAMRWVLEAARAGKGKPIAQKLAAEIINIARDTGSALKKREDVHRMAEANRAFAHFARY